MKNNYKTIISSIAVVMFLSVSTSCVQDLEREPITDVTSTNVYSDFGNYPSALAKLYGGIAVGGQSGADGNPDVGGIDGGFSNYMRQMYTMQVLSTDEAVIGWNDGTLPTIHKMTWDASNEFIGAIYYRIFTEIAMCNEFLRNTNDAQLATNNISGSNLAEAKYMRAEARFLRAQSYYHALDLFGNVPFVTEANIPGSPTPPQRISRAELFNFVEAELKACEAELKDARTNQYGRADKAAAWSLLARLYLNSKVYMGSEKNNEVITYCNKVINAGYSLKPNYGSLFMADNNVNNPEVILSVNYDGVNTTTYGGTTFLVHAAVGGSMQGSDFGINGGWGGIRTTKSFVNLFPTDNSDKRGRFHTAGQNIEINDLGTFTDGYAFIKYKNIKASNGAPGSDNSGNFVDSDIQLYRLADIYLMYAEATLRGGNGSMASAVSYINNLRARAYENNSGNVASIDLNFILDERARELSWEMTRRTDLIRYGKFTGSSYLWPWKGGVKNGTAVAEFRNLFPIPAKDIIANPNLVQNPGY